MLVLAMIAAANLAALEFGQLRGRAIAVDELHFAVCAARDNATGNFPSFGCHDQKTPLIYAVHQVVQWVAGTYSLPGIKAAAFGVVALGAALIGWLTRRLAGSVGATAAAALFLLTIGTDAYLFALKSEVLGTCFLLCGLGMLTYGPGQPRSRDWLMCGLCFGIAVLAKQTFAFAAVATAATILLAAAKTGQAARWWQGLRDTVALSAGAAVPMLLFALAFEWQGRLTEFLASILLYPSIYKAPAADLGVLRPLLWRVGSVFEDMGKTPLIVLLAVLAAAVGTPAADRVTGLSKLSTKVPWSVLMASAIGMLAVALVSPIYFSYHLLPAWMLLSVMAGVFVQHLVRLEPQARRLQTGFAVALTLLAAMMAATSWYTSGGKAKLINAGAPTPLIENAKGEYAFMLGAWPDFYFYNGLVPASTALVPWSLPGVPKMWNYAPPEPASFRARWLATVQQHVSEQLMRDFAATPPSYILIAHDMARAPGSQRVTDVLLLDRYLQQHCSYLGAAPENLGSAQSLFGCNHRRNAEAIR